MQKITKDRINIYSKVIIVVLAVLLIVLVAYIAVKASQNSVSESGGLVLDSNASDISESSDTGDTSGIKIPGYDSIAFPASKTKVSLTLMNPTQNSCGFVYELFIGDAKEPIYTSGLIEPGKKITEIELNDSLEQGEYTLYMKVNTYSMEDEKPLNGALITVPLTVY